MGYFCTSTGKATLVSVHVSGFPPRLIMNLSKVLHAILPGSFRTGVQDTHVEHSRDSGTRMNKTWHFSAKSVPIISQG